jgi:hypothetical protein
MTSAQKGEIAQLKVQLRAAQKGFTVSRPTVDVCRYDLIVDTGAKLFRAQIKYAGSEGSTSTGSVVVGLRKWPGRKHSKSRTYAKSECDLLLVYIPQVDQIACITSEAFDGKPTVRIRFSPAKNAQLKGIRLLHDVAW